MAEAQAMPGVKEFLAGASAEAKGAATTHPAGNPSTPGEDTETRQDTSVPPESKGRNNRDGEDAISKVSLAAWRMFDRLSRASEYGRVVSPGNGAR